MLHFFKKSYTYRSGVIKIKSDIKLDAEEIRRIVEIVNIKNHSSYDVCRSIYHELLGYIDKVQFYQKRDKILIKLIKK